MELLDAYALIGAAWAVVDIGRALIFLSSAEAVKSVVDDMLEQSPFSDFLSDRQVRLRLVFAMVGTLVGRALFWPMTLTGLLFGPDYMRPRGKPDCGEVIHCRKCSELTVCEFWLCEGKRGHFRSCWHRLNGKKHRGEKVPEERF